jgi:hypothetical protein
MGPSGAPPGGASALSSVFTLLNSGGACCRALPARSPPPRFVAHPPPPPPTPPLPPPAPSPFCSRGRGRAVAALCVPCGRLGRLFDCHAGGGSHRDVHAVRTGAVRRGHRLRHLLPARAQDAGAQGLPGHVHRAHNLLIRLWCAQLQAGRAALAARCRPPRAARWAPHLHAWCARASEGCAARPLSHPLSLAPLPPVPLPPATAYLIILGDCFQPMVAEAFGQVWGHAAPRRRYPHSAFAALRIKPAALARHAERSKKRAAHPRSRLRPPTPKVTQSAPAPPPPPPSPSPRGDRPGGRLVTR